MKNKFDTIILGLGAMGSAATYQLAKRGNKVLGIDKFSPPHVYGSTHGDTRITRQAIGEGEQYTPLSLRSYEIWREVEKEINKNLLVVTGGLIISSDAKSAVNHVEKFFEKTLSAAKKYDIKHDILDAPEIRKRFSQFNVKNDEVGYYEYNAGFLRPEECVNANLFLAEKYGAEIYKNEKVESFTEENGTVKVKTDKSEYIAEKLIVSAGPWLPELIDKEYADLFSIRRQVMYWFDTKGSIEQFSSPRFPVFIWELQGDNQGIYGFPAVDGPRGGVKIASEQFKATTTPETVNREVYTQEIREMYQTYVKPYFPGLTETCIKAVSCLYTVTPDFGFIIDKHPKHYSIIIASPCSGHGFKHSAAIGEVLAQLVVDGKSKINIDNFTISRLIKV
ncbi:MAG: N-methyl-L-tryptophan oxidase [Patescibacteria group bacterium]|nr:N-methyl-L-tryptophan oxidase [Patescibacteria group bacterium]MDE2015791.1 N-methyl-L-tryptophan oxidase [Patescibacteria group bacterium]MDE2226848.1 N-methyl-L-tryptophan oxidase [Patescibacteria group bacterium]